jgi:regulator of replication initiation timing
MSEPTLESLQAQLDELKQQNQTLTESNQRLEAKKEELLTEKKAVSQKAREAQEAADKARLEAIEKGGNVEDIQKAYEERLNKEREQMQGEFGGKLSAFESAFKGQFVNGIVSELFESDAQDIAKTVVSQRIGVDTSGSEPVPIILGDDGKPSALSLAEYKQNLTADAGLSRLLKGSQSRGAGPLNQGNIGGGAAKKFEEMSGAELKELRDKSPEKYEALKNQYYS